MVQLDIDEKERTILREVLESDVSDLRMEIAHTDRLDFRDMLKERKQALIKVVEALK